MSINVTASNLIVKIKSLKESKVLTSNEVELININLHSRIVLKNPTVTDSRTFLPLASRTLNIGRPYTDMNYSSNSSTPTIEEFARTIEHTSAFKLKHE